MKLGVTFMRLWMQLMALVLAVTPSWAADGVDSDLMFQNRKAALKRMAAPLQLPDGGQKSRSYDILAQTAQYGCGNAVWADYMSKIATLPVSTPSDGPVEMFVLPPLVRYLYQFGTCLSAEQKSFLLASLTNQRQWLLGHGTVNHAIMKASSWYLLAQYFPDAKWTHWDGKVYTSAQLMAELKMLMLRRSRQHFKAGHYELLSPTYAMVNLYPLLNLVDFANDEILKTMGDRDANLNVAALKVSSFHGVLVPPLTRKNYEQRNALAAPANYNPSVSQHILWYYFGEPVGFGLYDFQGRNEPYYFAMLALSNWRPEIALTTAQSVGNLPYSLQVNTPEFGIWDAATKTEIYGDSFIAEEFAVGTGNLLFDPFGYSGHIQTFAVLLQSTKALNQIECTHPYWNSNAGEDAWGQDRSSPFQQMYRYDSSSVVMLFDIPPTDPWQQPGNSWFAKRNIRKNSLYQQAQCRIPKSFDEVVTETNWVFVREGNSFAAIGTLKGTNTYGVASAALLQKYVVMKVHAPKTALYLRVDAARSDFNFTQFRAAVKSSVPSYDAETSKATVREADGTFTTVAFKLAPSGMRWAALPVISRNGKVQAWDNSGVITSKPVELKNSVLTIRGANGVATLNAP